MRSVRKIFAFVVMALLFAAVPQVRAFAQESPAAQARVEKEPAGSAEGAEKEKKAEDENDAYRHSAAVKALGAKLGMNPEQAANAFTIANLIVLVALVGWFLAKSLPKAFRTRNEAIQKHLVEARAASQEASSRLSSVEARLGKLDEQITALRTQAEKDAALDEQRIKASVEEEKQKILLAAEQEISAAAANARRSIQKYAADLAIDQAAKKLVVTAETDRLLVQDFARRLVGEGAKEGQN
ncbi:ATP synthase F0 subunit B [Edaphobacter flagellatus]|uniref:ATP synthase F0 subunit B n=1 Tax=Edaphobacter flagellatus TaxID=1933044 RepID=UPI0021B1A678|nr:ATP synthase F0 subunit B [Edaphobacter flagellatus]